MKARTLCFVHVVTGSGKDVKVERVPPGTLRDFSARDAETLFRVKAICEPDAGKTKNPVISK